MRVVAIAAGAAVCLSACSVIDTYTNGADQIGDRAAVNGALERLVEELRISDGVSGASFAFDYLGVLPGAAVSVEFEEEAVASDWSNAGAAIADATSIDAFDDIPVDVALSSDGVAISYGMVAGPTVGGLANEIRFAQDIDALLHASVEITVTVTAAGARREIRGPEDDGTSTLELLAVADEVSALAEAYDVVQTGWNFRGLQSSEGLPTGPALSVVTALVRTVPLLPIEPTLDTVLEGAVVMWWEGGGEFQYYAAASNPLTDLPRWSAVVAGARTVIETGDPRIGYSLMQWTDEYMDSATIQLRDCSGSRVPTKLDRQFAVALAASGVVVPEGRLGLCVPAD